MATPKGPTGFDLAAHDWPKPADPAAGQRLIDRFSELSPTEARLARQPAFARMLTALGGNSPYLSDLAVREAAWLRLIAKSGPAGCVATALAGLADTPRDRTRAQIAAILRAAKRRVALATAIADIGRIWTLEQVTGALSDLAEATLALALGNLLDAANRAGDIDLRDPASPGFVILGMGKLGARELNYSSDLDLILLYDPDAHPYHAATGGAAFSRLARDLVALMQTRDADGYVFRIDLRLRPDPAATAPVLTLPAAISYYESMGQNWERAAMIKARPVAGDHAMGDQFLDAIRPFVWRRQLDFAAIADIHAMKRRIDDVRQTRLSDSADPVTRLCGHDLKLGEGGIREIEFLVQTLELVWGGRNPSLREKQTLRALPLLVAAGLLAPDASETLGRIYVVLRTAEHRLQMIADRQTHSLPARAEDIAGFAIFLGYDSVDVFAVAMLNDLLAVRSVFEAFFGPPATAETGTLDFRGAGPPPPRTIETLRAMGFADAERIVVAARAWRAGRVRALRSQRARELLDLVLPSLLAAVGRQRDPDGAFARFDAMLARLPAGVQLLAMFQRNPALVERLASVLGAAPILADHLASVPSALEGLLTPSDIDPNPLASLRMQLADGASLDESLAITRGFIRGEDFRLAVAQLEGRLDVDRAGVARTALADAVITCLLACVTDEYAARHGRVTGGGMVVVALGKAGGREMLVGSDLDLMMIYDHPDAATESAGRRPLPVSQYFIRLAHALVAALTAPGAEGPLYAVDMRLRPSGNKGPVAVSLAGFARYHAAEAWTWERMALTRARVVAGPPALRRKVAAAIAAARLGGRAADPRADAVAMRRRMLRDLPPSSPWDVKLRAGGLVEIEFIAQSLQLAFGAQAPSVFSPTTRIALRRLARAGVLDPADSRSLIATDRLLRGIQSVMRMTVGRAQPVVELPASVLAALRQAIPELRSSTDVGGTLDDCCDAVRELFNRHIGRL